MKSIKRLVILYTTFAGIAATANILMQFIVSSIYLGPYAIYLSIACGIGVGLFIKYYLDKKWIFFDRTSGLKDNIRIFLLYSFIGLGTTLIFVLFELGFAAIGPWLGWRYIGAVIGLVIGYTTKYFMDRKFVFNQAY